MNVSKLLSVFSSKPRLDHPNPQKRLEALAVLDDSKQEEFSRVVKEDENSSVRSAALARITETDNLQEFLDDEDLAETVVDRLLPSVKPGHELFNHTKILTAYVSRTNNAEELNEVLNTVPVTGELAKLILSSSDTEMKSSLINLLASEELLVTFESVAKGIDRHSNKLARERLRVLKDLRTERETKLAHLESLRIAASNLDASELHYDSLRDAHERRWTNELSEVLELNQRLSAFGDTTIDVERERQSFPPRKTATAQDPQETLDFESIVSEFEASSKDLAAIERAETTWLDALKQERPETELSDRFYNDIQAARGEIFRSEKASTLETKFQELSIPFKFQAPRKREEWLSLQQVKRNTTRKIQAIEEFETELSSVNIDPDLLADWSEKLTLAKKSCSDVFQRCQDLEQQTEENLDQRLARLEELTEEGSLGKAMPVEREVRNLIARLPGSKGDSYRSKLNPFSIQIKEYLRWRSFAVMPKRLELCNAIEELVTNPLEPRRQLEQVKTLRTQWNELGPVANAEEARVQDKYNELATKAYKVCQEWFKEVDAQKKQNLQERAKVCEELEKYIDENDWDNPNWKVVTRTLRTAKETYHKFVPVDRSAARNLNKRFKKLTSDIQKRVNTQFKQNGQAKRELIEEAKAVYEDNDLQQNELLDRIKEIQAKWKTIGPASRREQALWEEFRGICDVAYEAFNRARTERRESIDENIKKANDLIDAIAKLTEDTDGSQQNSLRQELSNCQEQLQELFLPKRVRQDLNKRLADLRDNVQATLHAARERNRNSQLVELLHLEAELAGYEAGEKPIPDEWFEAVGNESVLFETRTSQDNDDELRDLVLRAEMIANLDAETEEDEERRLQLRVEYLKDNIGRGNEAQVDTAESLIKQWIAMAYGEQAMRDRFRKAVDEIFSAA